MLLNTTVDNDFIRFSGRIDHSHLPNPAQSEIQNLRERMRQRAEKEFVPLQQIAEEEVRHALLSGEALAVLPRVTSIGMFNLR